MACDYSCSPTTDETIDAYCVLTSNPDIHAQNDCTDVMRFADCTHLDETPWVSGSIATAGCEEEHPYKTFESLADDGQSAQRLCVAEGARKFKCTYIVARADVCPLSETQQQCMCDDPGATELSCADPEMGASVGGKFASPSTVACV